MYLNRLYLLYRLTSDTLNRFQRTYAVNFLGCHIHIRIILEFDLVFKKESGIMPI